MEWMEALSQFRLSSGSPIGSLALSVSLSNWTSILAISFPFPNSNPLPSHKDPSEAHTHSEGGGRLQGTHA